MIPRSGPAGAVGSGLADGADLYIAANKNRLAASGLTVELLTLEDPRDAPRALAELATVAKERRPLALLHPLGAPLNTALIESGLLKQNSLPVIGAWTAATSVRALRNPYLFFTRAGVQAECQRMVSHAATLGLTRAVVCFQDDAFGKDSLTQVERLAAATGLRIEARLPHPRLPPGTTAAAIADSMRAAVALIEEKKPQVALYFGSSLQFSELLRGERAGSILGVTMLASSVVDPAEVVQAVGSRKANGAAIVQVMPNSGVGTTPLVREFLTAAKSMRPAQWRASPFSLEGYVNARIAVEGLRRAATATPSALHTALAEMRRWDMGGITIDFSDGNREGNRYTTMAVIGSDGRLRF